MELAQVMGRMIGYSRGDLHDINHFLKVYAYAKTIGECEGLDRETQTALELAAIVHDIACPLCREKYGNTNGKAQEREGMVLARAFLEEAGVPAPLIDRVVFLVGHHHTLEGVDGADHRILLEADYLVNADESGHSVETIENALRTVFRTKTGIALLRSVYRLE